MSTATTRTATGLTRPDRPRRSSRRRPSTVELFGGAWIAVCGLLLGATGSLVAAALLLFPLAIAVATAWPLLVLAAAAAAIPLELLTFGGHITATQALMGLAATGAVLRQLRARELRVPATPLLVPVLLLTLSVVPGLLVAVDRYAVFQRIVMWSVFLVLFVLVAGDAGRKDLHRLFWCVAISGAIVSIVALAGGGTTEVDSVGGTITDRSGGTFTQANTLAAFLLLALPLQLLFAVRERGLPRALAAVTFLLSCGGLATSLSRGGLLGFGAIVLVMLLWRPVRRVSGVALIVMVVVLASGVDVRIGRFDAQVLLKRAASLGHSSGESKSERLAIYDVAPRIVADHPLFGIGARNLRTVAPSYGLTNIGFVGPFGNVHNTFLGILVEHGAFGLLALLLVVGAATSVALRVLRRGPPEHANMVLALVATFVGSGVLGLLHDNLPSIPIIGLLFVYLGALAACARLADEDDVVATAVPAEPALTPPAISSS